MPTPKSFGAVPLDESYPASRYLPRLVSACCSSAAPRARREPTGAAIFKCRSLDFARDDSQAYRVSTRSARSDDADSFRSLGVGAASLAPAPADQRVVQWIGKECGPRPDLSFLYPCASAGIHPSTHAPPRHSPRVRARPSPDIGTRPAPGRHGRRQHGGRPARRAARDR